MRYTIPANYMHSAGYTKFTRLVEMPYAQACIKWEYDIHEHLRSATLISYNTTVITIEDNGTLWCTGTYSNTTARHINRFCKEMVEFFGSPEFTYHTCKLCHLKDMTYNIFTGEFTPVRNDNGNLYI